MDKNNCIFCKIVKGEIHSYKIYEDKDYLAFLDISQFTQGHTLIIPKKHIEFIYSYEGIDKYFIFIQKIANHFRSLGFKYVDTLIFGKKVPHAHVHLVPYNDKECDYKEALKSLGTLQEDASRRPTTKMGNKVAEKFKLI